MFNLTHRQQEPKVHRHQFCSSKNQYEMYAEILDRLCTFSGSETQAVPYNT